MGFIEGTLDQDGHWVWHSWDSPAVLEGALTKLLGAPEVVEPKVVCSCISLVPVSVPLASHMYVSVPDSSECYLVDLGFDVK